MRRLSLTVKHVPDFVLGKVRAQDEGLPSWSHSSGKQMPSKFNFYPLTLQLAKRQLAWVKDAVVAGQQTSIRKTNYFRDMRHVGFALIRH